MSIKPSYKTILDITPYVPGDTSPVGQNSLKANKSIKLSSNENPFGCSKKVKQAITGEFTNLHRYSDGACKKVRKKISDIYNIESSKIVCGAGSDELITLLCMAYAAGEKSEVVYSEHGFLMYSISALSVGATPIKAKETSLKTDVDAVISATNKNTKIIFLANPNNPTGSYINSGEIEKLASSVSSDVIIVLDCAYHEYAEAFEDYPQAIEFANRYKNIVVLRTFSKAYGIPSLRLGWAYASEDIIDILNRVRGPFNVSGVAQVAGVAALEDQEFVKESVEFNKLWLDKMAMEFEVLGLKPYNSIGNFILVDFNSDEKAIKVDKFLREKGVTGRMMSAYGLASCMRFTIGLEDENIFLINSLREVLL